MLATVKTVGRVGDEIHDMIDTDVDTYCTPSPGSWKNPDLNHRSVTQRTQHVHLEDTLGQETVICLGTYVSIPAWWS